MQLQQQWQRQRGWASAEVRSGGGCNGVRCTRSGRSRRRVAHGSSVVGTLARHGSAPWQSAWVARSASPMQHGSLHASSV